MPEPPTFVGMPQPSRQSSRQRKGRAPNAADRFPDPQVVFLDNHLLVLRKPFGMLSQSDESNDPNALDWVKGYIRQKFNKPGEVYAALLHRLDRPVGGLMVFARTSKAAARLSEQFKEHTVEKVYYAVVEGRPEATSDVLEHYLYKLPGKNIVRGTTRRKTDDAKLSVLHYTIWKVVGDRTILEVRPISGRQHQIRVQLAKIGCPIVGDKKYGNTQFLPDKSIALFARELSFQHPTQKRRLRFELSFPTNEPWNQALSVLQMRGARVR